MTLPKPSLFLPYRATRGKGIAVMVPVLLANMVFMTWLIVVYFPEFNAGGTFSNPATTYLVAAAFVVFDLVGIYVLIAYAKPAHIEISRTGVTLTPMPILGFSFGTATSISMSEFTGVRIETFSSKPVSNAYAVLIGKSEKTNVIIDTPRGVTPQEFAGQLATTLHLEVRD
ncbi:MAG: hypothetical protein PHE27_01385 [Alphaproteobacteria bacterium]|nr:hypothetical protein [Alphaproteobacteria bacterium]